MIGINIIRYEKSQTSNKIKRKKIIGSVIKSNRTIAETEEK